MATAKSTPFFLRKPVSGTVIFAVFVALVVINFVVLVFYTSHSRHEEYLANLDEVNAHLFNTLYLLHISPSSEWQRIATVSQTPDLSVSNSDEPIWPVQFSEKNLSQSNQILQQIPDGLAVSILLDNGSWLNVKYTPHSNAQLMQIFIISLGALTAFAFLISAWSMVRFTQPLKQFKKAAEQLGVDLRADPVIEYGPAIVRETAYAMNQMQDRIRALLQDRNRMLAAISHDLRTPITRLKLRAQFASDQDLYLENINDLDEMEVMIDQILTYTKDASSNEQLVDLDLVALLLSICDEKCEQGFDVECNVETGRIPFKARPLALKRAFSNLVTNAVKYAKSIVVNIERQDNNVKITIDDDGPGIPEEHLNKVFTAFYRVDSARSSTTGGSGLGLAIVQDVINAHHGSIRLENRPEGGLRVVVNLDLSVAPSN